MESASNLSTKQILLACIHSRLNKEEFNKALPEYMEKYHSFFGINYQDSTVHSDYLEILCLPDRSYHRCGIEKYTDGERFVRFLEQHPTYRVSVSHCNNVTWYQIAEIIRFTVDLVEECYEAGRTELVEFLVDWSVSFINQQSCIYTSDGWADILTALPSSEPPPSDPHSGVTIHPSRDLSERKLMETARDDKEDHISLSSSDSSISPSERKTTDVTFRTKSAQEIDSGVNTFEKSKVYSGDRDRQVLTKETELMLLRCSCGTMNEKREGNFLGICDSRHCQKATCLICCLTVVKRARLGHISTHKVNNSSAITEEHIKANTSLYNAICRKCKGTSCLESKVTQHCKLCNIYMCGYPNCEKFGKYDTIKVHGQKKHLKRTTSFQDTQVTKDKSRELCLLRCACKNITDMERHGNFLSRCLVPSCDKSKLIMCLICGRAMTKDRMMSRHLGLHETGREGAITDEHVKSNLKLFNKVCEKCGQKSSCQYNSINKYGLAKCKCCSFFSCMFPSCEKFYPSCESLAGHYASNHKYTN